MHIKRVELSHFKSFGGTTQVPLLPGFTVISGPNGSGKSNILDALLFALGLSGSKGMRADRLPDLVNQSVSSRGKATIEASVTVTFALDEEDLATPEEEPAVPPSITDEGEDANSEALNGNEANGDGAKGRRNGHSNSPVIDQGILAPIVPFNEWNVTRKLRVTQQGTYTSNYFINGEPCTLAQLHEQLHRFRIYPEGYNVVLQGDVTSIISMNPRERREIIDELAGVASFDRKIIQAREKLDTVKEHEEKFHIVERELIAQRDRLAQDRLKAEKYQRLRTEFQNKAQWEVVLVWRSQEAQTRHLMQQIEEGDRQLTELVAQIAQCRQQIQITTTQLEQLNTHVKALGEDEQLALQSTLATREAELRQLQRQEEELAARQRELIQQINRLQHDNQENLQELGQVEQQRHHLETVELQRLQQERDRAQQALEANREQANAVAAASEAWVQEQAALHRQIDTLLHTLEPQRTEQARLQERINQLQQKIQEHRDGLEAIAQSLTEKQAEQTSNQQTLDSSQAQIQSLADELAAAERELQVQQQTQTRLVQEQRDKQRQLDKLEAQAQAQQEAQGAGAAQVILQTGIPGVCGLVAQLGRVEPEYQLALEIAAGGRLGNVVVEDDGVASAAIALLKERRAGRATFLPLNKIRPSKLPSLSEWKRPEGLIDYAVNLLDCEDRYRSVFAYVFGNTAVFTNLNLARPHMGEFRIVTLDGELLETSGAMTGGSIAQKRGGLRFGTVQPGESAEAEALRDRLREIERILGRCEGAIARASIAVKDRSQALIEVRQQHREAEIQQRQVQNQLATLVAQEAQTRTQLSQNSQELSEAQQRLQQLEQELPAQEAELQRQRQVLAEMEQSQTHHEWQQIQTTIRQQEAELGDRQLALRTAEQRLQDLENQRQRLQERINQQQQRVQEHRDQQTQASNQQAGLNQQQVALNQQILELRGALAELEQRLTTAKQERDGAERRLREQQMSQQQIEFQRDRLQEAQQERRTTLQDLQAQLAEKQAELPDPLPEIPADVTDLAKLQGELRSLQKRMEAMEPVNMLALEEYERTQTRLEELTQKLSTLEEERTELLLRIENFTTLRQRAFKEAFDAVNANFANIFAQLSDGDGHLQLDDPNDPFASGLNLVAHPKGKPVRRLASMSGGEKSLTALSFIFALQRYRPSPFYAFDEVDMFLDGANVERLAKMIKHQAQQAQFIVVSLRRPMIESAERTIGVTQARGAYTQVLGLDLQTQSASG
ncbi:chromosome segregation protein SMC [Leptolyngbya sp. FACHB-16]|uniref:chromosome segregation protein SMC n=1 Tax=unclassified Leptolyngbya TaxID=2650499 RepID=UPI001687B54D|nr:chromosome segregation protein SMC [Leptolyngbya sp. FACHB-16]